jgi:hypothetical protein
MNNLASLSLPLELGYKSETGDQYNKCKVENEKPEPARDDLKFG